MLEESRLKQLHELIDSYSKEELIWINGYLSGIVANGRSNGAVHTNGHDVKTTSTKKIYADLLPHLLSPAMVN